MDWDLAIKRNSKALKGIIEVLFTLLGLDGTDAASRIPRSLHSAVLGAWNPRSRICSIKPQQGEKHFNDAFQRLAVAFDCQIPVHMSPIDQRT